MSDLTVTPVSAQTHPVMAVFVENLDNTYLHEDGYHLLGCYGSPCDATNYYPWMHVGAGDRLYLRIDWKSEQEMTFAVSYKITPTDPFVDPQPQA